MVGFKEKMTRVRDEIVIIESYDKFYCYLAKMMLFQSVMVASLPDDLRRGIFGLPAKILLINLIDSYKDKSLSIS